MKIKYPFVTGETEVVTVPKELEGVMRDLQRKEWASNKRNSRHTCSLEAAIYEGNKYGYEDESCADDATRAMEDRIKKVAQVLTPLQRRRVRKLCRGMNTQEIANLEGVSRQSVQESIDSVRAKVKKLYPGYPVKRP